MIPDYSEILSTRRAIKKHFIDNLNCTHGWCEMSWIDDLPKPKGERSISISVSSIYRWWKEHKKRKRQRAILTAWKNKEKTNVS